MRGIAFKSLTFMLIIAFLVWSSNIGICKARRGKNWRERRSTSVSLSKKKGKYHNSNNHNAQGSKPKQKPPTTKAPSKSPPTSGPKHGTPVSPPSGGSHDASSTTIYNVLNFGAKGNGGTDDTKAFEAAWAAACKVEASTIVVPAKYTFLVGPISFSGPNLCNRHYDSMEASM